MSNSTAKRLSEELGTSEAIAQFVAECEVVINQIDPGREYRKADLDGFVRGCWPCEDEPVDVAAQFVAAISEPTEDMIRELCILTTRDQAGRHFTQWAEHYDALEAAGLVTINRPVHEQTGLSYDQQYWTVGVTEKGQDVVDANPELHPEV